MLSGLACGNNQLTELDLSANKSLLELRCAGNQLKQLDLRTNTKLKLINASKNQLSEIITESLGKLISLNVSENKLSASLLTQLLNKLPDVSSKEVPEDQAGWMKVADISNNPGSHEADVTTARNNGWTVKSDPTAIAHPANHQVVLTYHPDGQALHTDSDCSMIQLLNVEGQLLLQTSGQKQDISIAHYPQGTYIAVAYGANGDILDRLVFLKN